MSEPTKAYVDSCVLIGILKNEVRTNPVQAAGLRALVESVDRHETILFISESLRLNEILPSSTGTSGMEKLTRLLKSRKLTELPHDPPVWQLSAKIRDHYLSVADGFGGLSLPDATHLAAAIRWGIPNFYTWDHGKKDPGKRSLLSLSGNVAGHNLRILEAPPPAQGNLFPGTL